MAQEVQRILKVKRKFVKSVDLEELNGNDASCCGRK
jgi:hypothetical protein